MRAYFFLILGFAFSSLTGCVEKEMNSKDKVTHTVIYRTIQDVIDLNIGYQINIGGIGGSIDHKTGKKKTIHVFFDLNHSLSKDAARWLLVNIAKIFLANINEDKDLQEYLPVGGFTYKNIDIGIGFLTPTNGSYYHPDIACISLYKEKISYATNDPKDINGGHSPYKEVVYEPFEEALKIVESQERPEELKSSVLK